MMNGIELLLLVVVLAIGVGWSLSHRRKQRRQALATSEFTEEQRQWVRENWELWQQLPEGLRVEIEGLALVFLDEKVFEACGGLRAITDEMRFLVAAQACLLWTNQRGRPYPALKAILMYPDAYRAKDELKGDSVRLGESWSRGSVVLAWKSVKSGGLNDEDGHNLVLHEFAHQLDTVNGAADGFPELPGNSDFKEWTEVFQREYERLQADVAKGRRSVMDSYGATNEAEFFAVATETFFERASAMREEHPQLYQLLSDFFGTDPLAW
jgi:Mlc titration factor MtfA (ptsG expression regulator)